MVEQQHSNTSSDAGAESVLDAVFHALSDRTRRALLTQLSKEPGATVTELAAPHRMTLNAVSKHLKVLERAGLLDRKREGRLHRCSANLAALADASRTLATYEEFWSERLDELDAFLSTSDSK